MNILERVNKPEELRKLSLKELTLLCADLRSFIIDAVSQNPGHLGANLGVIELTVALHYVFNTPHEPIVWDVGHQAYAHKILTGRKKDFHTNRKLHGISGFPKMYESTYDSFGTGHSSTSISAALGMAIASKLNGDAKSNHIAVIGDGGLTGGMAFEAMNHAGEINPNLLIIFNDNGIAIDKNVGALQAYFAKITASKTYNRVKGKTWRLFRKTFIHHIIHKTATAFKSAFVSKSNLFESLNFRYFGPVDGHDLQGLISMLDDLKVMPGPKVLHIVTTKGKGYKQAEKDQTTFHAPGYFNVLTGEIKQDCTARNPIKYQTVFGKTLVELAEKNEKIVAITPAMLSGSSLNYMQKAFPERTFDVGIAEQHAVTFAAGLANKGLIPYCCIYSTFLQRAYDQIIHDVALQKLPVIFCIDRAGLVGEDGATHHGQFDLAYLRLVPNMIISAPMNEIELRNLMYTAQLQQHLPFSIRYPKGKGVIVDWQQHFQTIDIGKAVELSKGEEIAVLSIGHVGNAVVKALQNLRERDIYIQHYNMIFVKPIDEEVLHLVANTFKTIITVEEGTVKGGLASEVSEFVVRHAYSVRLIPVAVPDTFIQHGTNEELYDIIGLSSQFIEHLINENLLKKEKVIEDSIFQ